MESEFVKIVVFSPESHADKIRAVLAETDGHVGKYDCFVFTKALVVFVRCMEPTLYWQSWENRTSKKRELRQFVRVKRLGTYYGQSKAISPEEPAVDVYPPLTRSDKPVQYSRMANLTPMMPTAR